MLTSTNGRGPGVPRIIIILDEVTPFSSLTVCRTPRRKAELSSNMPFSRSHKLSHTKAGRRFGNADGLLGGIAFLKHVPPHGSLDVNDVNCVLSGHLRQSITPNSQVRVMKDGPVNLEAASQKTPGAGCFSCIYALPFVVDLTSSSTIRSHAVLSHYLLCTAFCAQMKA